MQQVSEIISRTGKSLLGDSEQVVEVSHKKFGVFWERYKVLDLERENHGEKLLQCVLDLNSVNI